MLTKIQKENLLGPCSRKKYEEAKITIDKMCDEFKLDDKFRLSSKNVLLETFLQTYDTPYYIIASVANAYHIHPSDPKRKEKFKVIDFIKKLHNE